jgi:hypothetical protein
MRTIRRVGHAARMIDLFYSFMVYLMTLNSSYHIVSNDKISGDYWIEKAVEGQRSQRKLRYCQGINLKRLRKAQRIVKFSPSLASIFLIVWANFNFSILVYSFIKILDISVCCGTGSAVTISGKSVDISACTAKSKIVNEVQNGSNIYFLPNSFDLTQALRSKYDKSLQDTLFKNLFTYNPDHK